jgi:hypothetical protein
MELVKVVGPIMPTVGPLRYEKAPTVGSFSRTHLGEKGLP